LITASILKVRRQPPQTTSRLILLPYAIVALLITCAMAAMLLVEDSDRIGNKESTHKQSLTLYIAVETALVNSLLVINDALLVGLFFCPIAREPLIHRKMYRTSILFNWRPLSLVLLCSYLVKFGEEAHQSYILVPIMLTFTRSVYITYYYHVCYRQLHFGLQKKQFLLSIHHFL
jgi:hypothetical protein